MGNQVLTPPQLDPEQPQDDGQNPVEQLFEADGSMWSSLVSNVRDAFAPRKQKPLQLSSHAVAVADPLAQPPLWKEMRDNVLDIFFPRKLPPLELTSKPIAVKEILAEKRSPASSFLSFVIHVVAITIIGLLLINNIVHKPVRKPAMNLTDVDVKPFIPITPKNSQAMGGGGGGGDHDIVDVSKGKLPKFDKQQITPPQIVRNENPKLPVPPSVVMPNIKLPDANMPNLGMPSSNQVALASNGSGSGGGMGSGSGGGLGSGSGGGIGAGSGGGYGGGVYHVGGGVSAPSLIYSVDPEFSDEARRAKYQGICIVSMIVDAQGNPQHIRISRPLGMGLDQKALDAVRQYRFKPAYFQGHPVPVEISIEVNFRIY
ncbi:MAG TPA: energy transducer TonB [Acidisarcina sp.]|nr:energy transducer TonB [Acidisarcina sp.]